MRGRSAGRDDSLDRRPGPSAPRLVAVWGRNGASSSFAANHDMLRHSTPGSSASHNVGFVIYDTSTVTSSLLAERVEVIFVLQST